MRWDCGLSEDGPQRPLRQVAGMVWDGGVAARSRVEPDFVAAGGLAIKRKSVTPGAFDDVAVSKAGQPPHQEPSTNGMSKESPTGARRVVPERSASASRSFRATSRAISNVSVKVRPWATRPGMSSEVARYTPSGSRSMCRFAICSTKGLNPLVMVCGCAGLWHVKLLGFDPFADPQPGEEGVRVRRPGLANKHRFHWRRRK